MTLDFKLNINYVLLRKCDVTLFLLHLHFLRIVVSYVALSFVVIILSRVPSLLNEFSREMNESN